MAYPDIKINIWKKLPRYCCPMTGNLVAKVKSLPFRFFQIANAFLNKNSPSSSSVSQWLRRVWFKIWLPSLHVVLKARPAILKCVVHKGWIRGLTNNHQELTSRRPIRWNWAYACAHDSMRTRAQLRPLPWFHPTIGKIRESIDWINARFYGIRL